MTTVRIFFRSCSVVHSFHGGLRLVGRNKTDVILTCLSSVIGSVQIALRKLPDLTVSLTVVDDHSDPQCIREIRRILSTSGLNASLVPTREPGNGPSLALTYELARDCAEEIIYFVEDDYLHCDSAVSELVCDYRNLRNLVGKEVVLFPCDYRDRYDSPYSSLIALGELRHWRTIRHTTATILLGKKVLLSEWRNFMALTRYGIDPGVSEDTSINRVYENVPCFSPIPSLAVHLHEERHISPHVDWRSWWKANQEILLNAASGVSAEETTTPRT